MILTIAASLTLCGFLAFVLGNLLGHHGVAVIGGVLVVGVGAMVATGGLEHRSGEVRTTTENNATVVEYQYAQADLPARLPLGYLLMLLGSVFVLRGLNSAPE